MMIFLRDCELSILRRDFLNRKIKRNIIKIKGTVG